MYRNITKSKMRTSDFKIWGADWSQSDFICDDCDSVFLSRFGTKNAALNLSAAACWVLHVASGVGKSGGPPSDEEYKAAMDALKAAYEDVQNMDVNDER
jgi:hypothetical protein